MHGKRFCPKRIAGKSCKIQFLYRRAYAKRKTGDGFDSAKSFKHADCGKTANKTARRRKLHFKHLRKNRHQRQKGIYQSVWKII